MAIRRRRLGRTGVMVPELGLGAMDTPTSPEGPATLAAALDAGIEFIDTAREYAGSEYLIGDAVRRRGREGMFLASKTFRHTADGAQWEVDASLRALGVPAIDLYQLHDISSPAAWDEVMAEDTGALWGLKTAQYRGLVRYIGVSCHDLEVARRAVLSGEFDTVMVEYSAFYPESRPVIELAAERDVAVVAMRPLGGSGRTSVMRTRAANGEAGLVTAAHLLRYVLSHPGVSVAIPGARHPDRIHQNAATVSDYTPMDEAEMRALEAAAARFYD